ncbi:MAG TPA: hypothetical protein VH724_03145 [Candidatus Angelobacter sp.]|nr:hypothetical protein [Candidatus Angelobacter sp.]
MMPFELLSCSWPRPVEESGRRWVSAPEWDAPRMPHLPQFHARNIEGHPCWAVDWCNVFSQGLRFHSHRRSGEMRGFHVAFELRMNDTGKLVFWDDDGCIIRRGDEVVHEDRECHALTRHEIAVRAGECLEISHWQYHGDWMWAGKLEPMENSLATVQTFSQYLPKIQKALRQPNGPALKMYFGGASPARSVLCLYSMILNGYRPSAIHIFGDYQWSHEARQLFTELLPFAVIVPTDQVREQVAAVRPELADMALSHWQVMKLCVGLMCGPNEYCFMDDDMLIIDRLNDALGAFTKCDLVYAPDADYSSDYSSIWSGNGTARQLTTGNINTGLYWLRNKHKPAKVAERLLNGPVRNAPAWQWEQGFMATEFARDSTQALSTQRYFYPYFDGLPGGLTGYDYAGNPCGFASVHFGGLAEKPCEAGARTLAAQLLNRKHRRSA